MIKTLTLHNNDTTPRHNGIGHTHCKDYETSGLAAVVEVK